MSQDQLDDSDDGVDPVVIIIIMSEWIFLWGFVRVWRAGAAAV